MEINYIAEFMFYSNNRALIGGDRQSDILRVEACSDIFSAIESDLYRIVRAVKIPSPPRKDVARFSLSCEFDILTILIIFRIENNISFVRGGDSHNYLIIIRLI